jgi:hypothetical protein
LNPFQDLGHRLPRLAFDLFGHFEGEILRGEPDEITDYDQTENGYQPNKTADRRPALNHLKSRYANHLYINPCRHGPVMANVTPGV